MGLFDIFRKKNRPVVTVTETIKTEAPKTTSPFNTSDSGPIIHRQYSDADITNLTNAYIDRNGLNGMSKEEAELAKTFFSALFIWFHNNAVKNDRSKLCMRRDCDLTVNQPVFQTASRTLCADCALQYVIGNCRDWYYYLSDFASQAGSIPPDLQREGIKIKEQIAALRSGKTDDMSDEQLLRYILDDNNDMDSRAEAVLKIKSVNTVNQLVDQINAYKINLNALEFDLPREMVIKIIRNQTQNNERAGKVRTKATLKLGEEDLEAVLEGKIPGAVYYAIGKIENKEFLRNYIETTKYDDNREQAKKRLQELEKDGAV